jgi:hypothetical protein
MAVQVKRWKTKNHVQAPVVQQVRSSFGTHEQGLIITTSDFSAGAKREAERPNAVPVALMNGDKLVELLAEYQVGIRRQAHDLFALESAGPDADGLRMKRMKVARQSRALPHSEVTPDFPLPAPQNAFCRES